MVALTETGVRGDNAPLTSVPSKKETISYYQNIHWQQADNCNKATTTFTPKLSLLIGPIKRRKGAVER